MANSESADLMAIGAHCAHPGCHQLDFLPFKCGGCGKTYCLDHRVCGCTAASNQVVVCPLCARAVIISPGEDVELVFDRWVLGTGVTAPAAASEGASPPRRACWSLLSVQAQRNLQTQTVSHVSPPAELCLLCARSWFVQSSLSLRKLNRRRVRPPACARRHTRTDCDPANYDRVHKKRRCPAGSCREKLTSTNSYTCRECGVTVCLRHRLPGDHQCAGRAASTAAAATGRLSLSQSLRRMLSSGGGSSAAARVAAARPAAAVGQQDQQQPAATATNGSAGGRLRAATQRAAAAAARTTDSLQAQLQQYRQRQSGGAPATGTPPAAGGERGEVVDLTSSPPAAAGGAAEACPQCGARFATVQQLIEHAETAHAGGWSSGAISMQQPAAGLGGGGLERCPHCGRQFADPVELVAHVERQHAAAGSSSNCVLC